ncbi:hypothetical protein ACQ4M3_05900 [Leptolyngbya sp. AN03gr2]|uniref:hypothetical protein n=1 Tax=unclassified Leptolyngbya TaxID=2650499 RepID=UPI003D320DE3
MAVLLLTACNRPPTVQSICSIENRSEYQFSDSTRLTLWNFRASQLKQLTAQLLVIQNGKVQTAKQIQYDWRTWSNSAIASGQLAVLLQSGQPFGAANLQLPQLTATLQSAPAYIKAEQQIPTLLRGDLELRTAIATDPQSLQQQTVLYAAVFSPSSASPGSISLSSDLRSLIAASKPNRTVVAVTLECQSQTQGN